MKFPSTEKFFYLKNIIQKYFKYIKNILNKKRPFVFMFQKFFYWFELFFFFFLRKIHTNKKLNKNLES